MIVYSLIGMAKANGINPLKYLEYIWDAHPDKKMTDEEFGKLSPWNDEDKKHVKTTQSKILEFTTREKHPLVD